MRLEVHIVLVLALAAMGWCQQENNGAKALFGSVHFKDQPSSQNETTHSKPTSSPTPLGASNQSTNARNRASAPFHRA